MERAGALCVVLCALTISSVVPYRYRGNAAAVAARCGCTDLEQWASSGSSGGSGGSGGPTADDYSTTQMIDALNKPGIIGRMTVDKDGKLPVGSLERDQTFYLQLYGNTNDHDLHTFEYRFQEDNFKYAP
eukprot:1889977-Prymnesium_polylepis.2